MEKENKLEELVKDRISNFRVTISVLEEDGIDVKMYEAKVELLESILDEYNRESDITAVR